MPQRPRTPPKKVLASVSKLKRPAPPRRASHKTLSAAVADDDATEREVLVLVRKRLAEVLDGKLTPASLMWAMRQFREVDGRIRVLDAVVPDVADSGEDCGEGDDEQGDAFDPSKI